MSLMRRFYTDPYLHIRSFSLNLIISAALCAAAYAIHNPEFYRLSFAAWQLLLIPLGVYAGGMSAVFIHNATHGSFRHRQLNRLCGELAGLHQLWGFTGWKLIHLVHHHYSDDVAMDVHPPKGMTFWKFTQNMFLYSSVTINKRYREHWGTGRRTRIMQKSVMFIFTALAVMNLLFWMLLLGPAGFILFYIPSYITNHLLFAHINYYAHPQDEATGNTAPANLNHNLYYKLANLFWCGIYFHGNHHRRPLLFNPRYMPPSRSERMSAMQEAA